jgi:hypothetical protein
VTCTEEEAMDQDLSIARYRWECFRRKDVYKKEWGEFFDDPRSDLAVQLLTKWGCASFPQSRDFNRKWDDIDRIPGTIWTKELEGESFWPDLKEIIQEQMFLYCLERARCYISPSLLPKPESENDVVVLCPDPNHATEFLISNDGMPLRTLDKKSMPDELTIKIVDFRSFLTDTPHTQNLRRELILDRIAEQLVMWQRASLQHGLSSKTRFRFNEYDRYLAVWDLVQEKGRRWKAICKEIFPDDVDLESAMKKVRNSYWAAEKMIENAHEIFKEI